jgi:hypothetical protein
MLDEYIEKQIEAKARDIISAMLSPVEMLKGFEHTDVLMFDEVCHVLRLSPDELENAIRANAVPCVKPGKPRSTWRFPKRLLTEYLLGEWQPKKHKGLGLGR